MISVNENALRIVEEICKAPKDYGVLVEETDEGARIIDAGIKSKGGLQAGKAITEICLGGLGVVNLTYMNYGDILLPTISVYTDWPVIATLGSQFAGWHIKVNGYSAIASGPARALALKPKSIYKEISYKDQAEAAVIVLEASKIPPSEVIRYISSKCNVDVNALTIIVVPTSSLAGFVQVSGRIVETGIHRLFMLGMKPEAFISAYGFAPIMPVHPDTDEAMGRMNDALLYGGVTSYFVAYDNDEKLQDLVKNAVSSSSKVYGKPFVEIFRDADFDFYKIDPNIFAPASLTVNNVISGKVFTAGAVNVDMLRRSTKGF
ncbi:methenyltetrahydromethanopterin cyclohydrolase, partial [Candidatus Bathyarchaeota archaeon]